MEQDKNIKIEIAKSKSEELPAGKDYQDYLQTKRKNKNTNSININEPEIIIKKKK